MDESLFNKKVKSSDDESEDEVDLKHSRGEFGKKLNKKKKAKKASRSSALASRKRKFGDITDLRQEDKLKECQITLKDILQPFLEDIRKENKETLKKAMDEFQQQ